MDTRAVIYSSKHGTTEIFAKKLGTKYHLPVINIQHISGYTFQNIPVIYCGWIKNGKIQGLKKARCLFSCFEIYAIGTMKKSMDYSLKIKRKNNLNNELFHYLELDCGYCLTLFEKLFLQVFQPLFYKKLCVKRG